MEEHNQMRVLQRENGGGELEERTGGVSDERTRGVRGERTGK